MCLRLRQSTKKEVNLVRAGTPLTLMSVGTGVLIQTFEYFEVSVFQLLSMLSKMFREFQHLT
jgi:hypothetical protein